MVQLLAEKLNIFSSKIHRYQGKSTLRVLLRETETFWPKLKSRFLEGYLIFPPFFKQNYEFTPSIPHVCGPLRAILKIV